MKFHPLVSLACLVLQGCNALSGGYGSTMVIQDSVERRAPLQDIVTWDDKSLFIRGERIMIWSGEVHPFRLPVPSLWLDVFQKVKALGFNAVSFYVYWALLEGTPGKFSAEGIFDPKPFFQAATDAGIYLIARPGPYINAEVAGGGFPGWIQRVNGTLRTSALDFQAATDNYMSHICQLIAEAQITNGGPIILMQPENEFTYSIDGFYHPPDPAYMQYVQDQAHKAGVVVPMISNDAFVAGRFVPGSGQGQVDIYGYDQYPLGFGCANPGLWPAGNLSTDLRQSHMLVSPSTPHSIPEFQGGGSPPWGGASYENCEKTINHEFERVFYKNNFAAGVSIMNLYMIFGGTSWGYISHADGYSSYDYGAVIREDGRTVDREKYSELKIEAQFIRVSPGFLEATPETNFTTGIYTPNVDIAVTPLLGEKNGSFFVARKANYSSFEPVSYTLRLPTSAGNITVPQLGGNLTLSGRDSKIHVTDYPLGSAKLLYSTAEIFTWKQFEQGKVVIVYGGHSELHELAIVTSSEPKLIEGVDVKFKSVGKMVVMQWKTSTARRIVHLDDLLIHILDRNSAYNYWVPDLLVAGDAPSVTPFNPVSLIINGGYLVRSASIDNETLLIKADFNSSATATLEIIGVPKHALRLVLNDADLDFVTNDEGSWIASVDFKYLELAVPVLSSLDWMYIDSLPEIETSFDDSNWPLADHTYTNNSKNPLRTPDSLYGSDYGYNAGVLVFRGHFIANGSESSLSLTTMGGLAYASSVFLNVTFLGSWSGDVLTSEQTSTYAVPELSPGKPYVLTILVDNNGNDENWLLDSDTMKNPRGIRDYSLSSPLGAITPITWKLTGNLGGESYIDETRGPLNEGGLFVERQGYHQPRPPLSQFTPGSPFDGIDKAGVAFYTAPLVLDYPSDKFDIPISFQFVNKTEISNKYRAMLFVNGFQFGKYISHIGPQTNYPVPEGILNYHGENWIGLLIWAVESKGAKVPDFYLSVKTPVMTGRQPVELVDAPSWTERTQTY